ncbi:MAG: DegT/DnrJ/EryC1/StrS family aminotransferase [Candidatus Omnitrophica bacterium]|nr:DegT/DnrJ/EryC1/StrS family aminotransferase [Candidatus Omnitrophota bacterium]
MINSKKSIPLFRPFFPETCRRKIAADIKRILADGRLMLGEFTEKFEALFAAAIGVPYAVSVNSCTTALTICLKYFNVTGREVLVPSGSFVTSVSSILFAGGTPVFVDMNPDTLSFDINDLKKKITRKTKGVIWVHLAGFISPECNEIFGIARENNLFVIEDVAQALGADIRGRQAGSFADAACFSFYPTKIITCGTGGMITTKDKKLKKYAEEMRLFGKDAGTGEVKYIGNDWFLDEIRACVGYHHLTGLKSYLAKRRKIAGIYHETLKSNPNIRLLKMPAGNRPSYYQYPVFLKKGIDRRKLVKHMKEKYGIQVKGIYIPCHKEKIFDKFNKGKFDRTEETLDSSLCLPVHVQMIDKDALYVSECLIRELKNLR